MDQIIVLPRQGMLWEKERKEGNMISTLSAFLRSVKPLSPIAGRVRVLGRNATSTIEDPPAHNRQHRARRSSRCQRLEVGRSFDLINFIVNAELVICT